MKIWVPYLRSCLGSCGNDVVISKRSIIAGSKNIFMGEHVYIGPNALIYTTEAKLYIGNYVMAGPNITIITGSHRTDVIGEYMYNVHEKLPENDMDVIIEDDVWIGANAMILKGATIGRGSVVAGGAVVTKSIPPYSIFIGKDKIKSRFHEEELIQHEKVLAEKYRKNEYERV
jgi:acetyltransferase-like isoleucine patch superfamily enzyme